MADEEHAENDADHKQHEELEEECRKTKLNIAGGIRPGDGPGQTLIRLIRDHDSAPAGGIEQRAQADQSQGQAEARSDSVQQLAGSGRQAEKPYDQGRQQHAQNNPLDAVAAEAVVGQRLKQRFVLFNVTVPVNEPREKDAEDHGNRKEHPDRRVVPVVHRIQGQRQAEARRHAQGDDNGAPVDCDTAGKDRNLVHGVPSVSGMAVAK